MEASTLTHAGRGGLLGRRSPLLKLQGDERLVAAIRAGNDAAFETLFDRYHSRLLAFCRHMLRSTEDAEDVLQEVFVKAHAAMLADDRPINVRPWLYRIARNRCLNHLRRPVPEGQDTMDTMVGENGVSTADRVQGREDFRALVADVQDLPETQRTALLLREIDALSYEEVAQTMGTTVPAVKSLLVRARMSLADATHSRQLTCDDVRLELAEAAEGLGKASGPARVHVKRCEGCHEFRRELRQNSKALAALSPLGPLAILHQLIVTKLGGSGAASGAAAGSTAAGGGSAVTGAAGMAAGTGATAAAGAGAAATGGGVAAAGATAVGGIGTAIGAKAAATAATAALLTAGAVEVGHIYTADPDAAGRPAAISAPQANAAPSGGVLSDGPIGARLETSPASQQTSDQPATTPGDAGSAVPEDGTKDFAGPAPTTPPAEPAQDATDEAPAADSDGIVGPASGGEGGQGGSITETGTAETELSSTPAPSPEAPPRDPVVTEPEPVTAAPEPAADSPAPEPTPAAPPADPAAPSAAPSHSGNPGADTLEPAGP